MSEWKVLYCSEIYKCNDGTYYFAKTVNGKCSFIFSESNEKGKELANRYSLEGCNLFDENYNKGLPAPNKLYKSIVAQTKGKEPSAMLILRGESGAFI